MNTLDNSWLWNQLRETAESRGSPRLSDLIHDWLREKIGKHQIQFVHGDYLTFAGTFAVKIDGILVCWIDDVDAIVKLASGEQRRKGEVLRRRPVLIAADPLLFDKLWERIEMISSDTITDYGFSLTVYKA